MFHSFNYNLFLYLYLSKNQYSFEFIFNVDNDLHHTRPLEGKSVSLELINEWFGSFGK